MSISTTNARWKTRARRGVAVFAMLLLAATSIAASTTSAATTSNGAQTRSLHSAKAVKEHADQSDKQAYNNAKRNSDLLMVTGTVTAVSDSSISVRGSARQGRNRFRQQQDFTLSVDSDTVILRKGFGRGTISEVSEGDRVQVWAEITGNHGVVTNGNNNSNGNWNGNTNTNPGGSVTGHAVVIWDKSIWLTQIKGTVTQINSADQSFTLMVMMRRVGYTTQVKTDSNTKFLIGNTVTNGNWNGNTNTNPSGTGSFSDLQVGQSVTVLGSWSQQDQMVWAKEVRIGNVVGGGTGDTDVEPKAAITSPDSKTKIVNGQAVTLTGTCTDKSKNNLTNCTYSWEVKKVNKSNTETVLGPTAPSTNPSSTFTPTMAAGDSVKTKYTITLTVQNGSKTDTASRDVKFQTVTLKIVTTPKGLDVGINGSEYKSRVSLKAVTGTEIEIEAISPQDKKNTTYIFDSWSDGGDQTHTITAPDKNTTYTAVFHAEGATNSNGNTNGNHNGNHNGNYNTNHSTNQNTNTVHGSPIINP